MIRQITIKGLLSFGPDPCALPLGPLNVLIGPNGSGKSNLLEMLSLLRAAPVGLATPIKSGGGIREWLWKPDESGSQQPGEMSVRIANPNTDSDSSWIDHQFRLENHGGRLELTREEISLRLEGEEDWWAYRLEGDRARFRDGDDAPETTLHTGGRIREVPREQLSPEESILSQWKSPDWKSTDWKSPDWKSVPRYKVVGYLQDLYENIRLYRNWTFGPASPVRLSGRSDLPKSHLHETANNIASVWQSLLRTVGRKQLLEPLGELFPGIEDVMVDSDASGNAVLYLQEEGGRQTPASRLSDGTLRYLSLLAVLLHPEPPKIVALEEPELGLHPDILPHVAKLLQQAADRMQLIVTTHSKALVDALSSDPESVVVCERHDGRTRMKRLDSGELSVWLEDYALGQLWGMGHIGGNRW